MINNATTLKIKSIKIHHQHLIPKPANGKDKDENKKITDKPVAFPDGQLRTYQAAQRVTIRCSKSGDFEQISLLNIFINYYL